jgi:hypothetical protein
LPGNQYDGVVLATSHSGISPDTFRDLLADHLVYNCPGRA